LNTWHLLGDEGGGGEGSAGEDEEDDFTFLSPLAPLPDLRSKPARSLFTQLHFLTGLLFGLYRLQNPRYFRAKSSRLLVTRSLPLTLPFPIAV